MLYEISETVSAKNSAILLHPGDNVLVARVAIASGQSVEAGPITILARDSIPPGHKLAIRKIAVGEPVYRYGNPIGFATQLIEPGQHVHEHNLGYREVHTAGDAPAAVPRRSERPSTRTFLGFARHDGRVGTRNYIAVVAASNCAAYTSELIARSFAEEALPSTVDGIVAFPHGEGCGMSIGPDSEQLQRTLKGVLDHPNVSAALILGLGCEVNQISHYLGKAGDDAPATLQGLTMQETGGTHGAVQFARGHIKRFIERAAEEKRSEVPASKMVLGLNCGGSDSFSGITANPALGHCSDLIVEQGGTVVLAETTEIIGAEHLLTRRARSPEIAAKLLRTIDHYKGYLRQFGGSFNDNPSPGNKEGGLTNILEKSLGAVAKAGTSTLEDVLAFAERIESSGFLFMDTPGYDPVSITGLAAGGVNLIAFTTGRGSAIGFPNIPVLKIASNSHTFRRMRDNMDVNAGRIADGQATVSGIGEEIFEMLLRVASGERTCAERIGHHEFAPWRIGPVM